MKRTGCPALGNALYEEAWYQVGLSPFPNKKMHFSKYSQKLSSGHQTGKRES